MANLFDLIQLILVFSAAWFSFGYYIDTKLNNAYRETVFKTMNTVKGENNPVNLFLGIFDLIFKPNEVRMPRIGRSILASCISLTVVIFLMMLILGTERIEILIDDLNGPEIIAPIIYLICLNFIGDILSLWETRIVMGRMANTEGQYQWLFLILDLIATILVFMVGVAIVVLVVFVILLANAIISELPFSEFHEAFDVFPNTFELLFLEKGWLFCYPGEEREVLAIYFYTSLFTSVWLWIFWIGVKAWPLFRWIGGVLNVDKFPVGSAMALGSVSFCFIAITAMSLLWILWGGHFCG